MLILLYHLHLCVGNDIFVLLLMLQVQWPLSIVISRKALTKYQLIFRLVFHCKHVNRQLCGAWQLHQVWSCYLFHLVFQIVLSLLARLNLFLQGVRPINMRGTAIPRSSLLCRSMLKFIDSLLHYLTFEVCFAASLSTFLRNACINLLL